MEHIETGILSLDDEPITAEVAWLHYQTQEEFVEEGVVFEQFALAIARHRKALRKKKWHVQDQMVALEHDTQFMSTDTHDRKGDKKFYGTQAHRLLKQDIQDELHTVMGVEALFWLRDEYCLDEWDLPDFKRRVKQEEATQKFYYYMEVKRAKKADKQAAKEAARVARQVAEAHDYYDINQEEDPDDDDNAVWAANRENRENREGINMNPKPKSRQ